MNYQAIHDQLIEKWLKRDKDSVSGHLYKHHIVPRHEDPNSEDIVLVTMREHAFIHRLRYKITGTTGNYIAWKALENAISKEEMMLLLMSAGGMVGGKNTRLNGSGIFSPDWDRSKYAKELWASGKMDYVRQRAESGELGKEGAQYIMENQLGIHDPDHQYLRSEWGKLGAQALNESGNRSGCCTAEWSENNPELKREYSSKGGKIGGKSGKGMVWWNDGVNNKRSKTCPGEGWVRGMLMSEKKRKQVESIAGWNKGVKK